jgi:DNA-binding MarR family transcriptional regulator
MQTHSSSKDTEDRADPQGGPVAFIDDYVAYLLAQASHLISHEFHRVVRQAGLSVLEWRVLATLCEGDARSVGEVATIILVPQSTLTRLADRMVAQELLARVQDEDDRRITRLQVTAKGRRIATRLVVEARRHEDAVLAPLGAPDAAALKKTLRLLIRLHMPAPKSSAASCAPARPSR